MSRRHAKSRLRREEREAAHVDASTVAYFDEHLHEYPPERLQPVVQFISEHRGAEASLVDVGCGTGNVLAHLGEQTGISRLAGIDPSPRYLEICRERVGCETHQGSILDRAFVDSLSERFDFAVLAAVLHHLVGTTRRQSQRNAALGLENTIRLLKPGGYLFLHEPLFAPRPAMWSLFYVKRLVTRFTDARVPILSYWSNIGAPVVSYFDAPQMRRVIIEQPEAELAAEWLEPFTLDRHLRPFLRRLDGTFAVRRAASP